MLVSAYGMNKHLLRCKHPLHFTFDLGMSFMLHIILIFIECMTILPSHHVNKYTS